MNKTCLSTSPASIDIVNQVLPIRVTGKEGGSMRAQRNNSPQRIYQTGTDHEERQTLADSLT